MAYEALTDAETNSGEPTTQRLFKKIKDDLADHESRMLVLDSALGGRPPIEFGVFGLLTPPMSQTEVLLTRVDTPMTITAARLLVGTAGTAGQLEVDIEYSRGGGPWASILSTTMVADFSDGDHFLVNGVLAVTSLLAGDLLRLNVNGVQTSMRNFLAFLENQAA